MSSNGSPRRIGSSPAGNGSQDMPRTHDTSFTECHIPDIKKIGAELNEAIQAAWPKRHSIRYTNVNVLLVSWEADDLGVEAEIEPLRRVLADRYHFQVQAYKIPSMKPDKALKKRIFDFLEGEDEDTLLIVYYAGHARGALQSNEASLWFASRNDRHIVVPSGGIQSMLEEADADVILLCDCCHSTAIPTTDSQQRSKKVMEAITACGYEGVAAEVGDHSFTDALTHILATASKGSPFTISELHARVVSRLKCWAPKLLKGEDGNYVDTDGNQLLYEQQPRRTPIFTVVCRANPTRSILLAPLGILYPSPSESGEETYQNVNIDEAEVPSSNDDIGEHLSRKRKGPVDIERLYPSIILSVRLEKPYDKQAWLEWARNAPAEAKDIRIEGAYASFSTLLLIRMPVAVWNLLPRNAAYTFVGYVTSGNYAFLEGCNCTGADICEACSPASQSFIQGENALARADTTESSNSTTLEQLSTGSLLSETSILSHDERKHSSRSVSSQIDSAGDLGPVAMSTRTSSQQMEGISTTNPINPPELGTLEPYSTLPHPQMSSAELRSASSTNSMITTSQAMAASMGPLGPSSRTSKNRRKHGHRHSHGSSETNQPSKGSNQTPDGYHFEWFWNCCNCGFGAISVIMLEVCPNPCGHIRCSHCPTESHKVRDA